MKNSETDKNLRKRLNSSEGIILSLLYLGKELEDENMPAVKQFIDEALIASIREITLEEISDIDAINTATLLKRAFLLDKEAMLRFIEIMTDLDSIKQNQY